MPPARFVMHYEVDACPLPGMIHIKRIAVVFSIGRFDFQDKLDEPVSNTAQRIVDWAKGRLKRNTLVPAIHRIAANMKLR